MIKCWTFKRIGRRRVKIPLSPLVVAKLPQAGMWFEHKSGVSFLIEGVEGKDVLLGAYKNGRRYKCRAGYVATRIKVERWILKTHMKGWGI